MTSLQQVAPHAEHVSSSALQVNAAAATGLLRVLQSNLGPTGTLKLLVGGSVNQLRLTKDGRTLLHEMQIQHPTAALIARSATAQDAVTGDGTTSTVLLAGELLRLAATVVVNTSNAASPYYLHPRHVADGLDIARNAALEFLDTVTVPVTPDVLLCTARTSLSTKLNATLVEKVSWTKCMDLIGMIYSPQSLFQMSHAVVDAVKTIQVPDEPIDLHRIEILTSQRRTATESRLVRGIVLDHGARHPDMPTSLQQCYTLVCNVSLEYEQTETASGFAYSTAAERQALVESERQWLDERCREIIQLKRQVCTGNETFCIFNQKGVDPLALDMFAKEGIFCLRRCKRRNMERLTLACGGDIVLSIKDLDPSVLGRAGRVNQVSYSDDETFTFVEDLEECKSCTLFLQGPNKLTVEQIKDAVKDGLRSCKNAVEDKVVVPGGGAFEIAAAHHLESLGTKGKASLGVQVFKDALLIIPKTLAANSGFDVPDILLQLQQEHASTSMMVGLDCHAGCPMLSAEQGVYDNRRVKRQSLYLATMLANQLLLVDEVMRAGKQMGKQPDPTDM